MVASEIRQRGAASSGFVQHQVSFPRKSEHSITHISMYIGPMARSVPDIALMMAACVGNDDRDPMANPCTPQAFLNIKPANLKMSALHGLRILEVSHRWMMGSGDVLVKGHPLRTYFSLLIVVTQILLMPGIVFGHYVASIIWLATRHAMIDIVIFYLKILSRMSKLGKNEPFGCFYS